MKGKKIFKVTRVGQQICWVAADSINEAIKKARSLFKRSYVGRTVIEKVEWIGTVDA